MASFNESIKCLVMKEQWSTTSEVRGGEGKGIGMGGKDEGGG